ncbi:hypothetical protein EHS25_005856 [Saitozyma podzolica]|uniref:dihydropyrimidinase n=1 Tax=Saitozyma podzolica TaxID=1890683 RepID=A0A427XVB7_9TREE|nr:hypothetical protein EHS25_005856 [Saitozyma podzolica]
MSSPFDFDLVVKNGIVVTAADETACDIGVKDGVVVVLGKNLPVGPNCEIIDAEGGYVTPGGVDSHVHIGQSASNARSADDWTTGTRGAISGGTTTVVAFAVQAKGKQVMPAVEAYYALADGQAHCDYSFHAIITDPTEEVVKVEVPKMVDFGISSVKVGREGSEHRPGVHDLPAHEARRQADARHPLRGAEAGGHDHGPRRELGHHQLDDGPAALPGSHRGVAPRDLAACPGRGRGDEPRHRARRGGRRADAHRACLGEGGDAGDPEGADEGSASVWGDVPALRPAHGEKMKAPGFEGAKCVCAPPLREDPLDNEGIWEGLSNGTFTVFSSDHAPYNFFDERGKQLGMINNPTKNPRGNFKNTPNGLPGVCTRTPLLWSEGVLKGRISRQRFVELNSSNAAKLYGMYPKKGTIQPGSDADFVIFRSETARKPLTIRQEDLHHGADYTPYEGMQVQDWPRLVILRGKVAYDGASNTVKCEKGSGQFIKRGLSSLPGPRGRSDAWINGFDPHKDAQGLGITDTRPAHLWNSRVLNCAEVSCVKVSDTVTICLASRGTYSTSTRTSAWEPYPPTFGPN